MLNVRFALRRLLKFYQTRGWCQDAVAVDEHGRPVASKDKEAVAFSLDAAVRLTSESEPVREEVTKLLIEAACWRPGKKLEFLNDAIEDKGHVMRLIIRAQVLEQEQHRPTARKGMKKVRRL